MCVFENDLHCLKVTVCISDPLRSLYVSIFAATTSAPAASVYVYLAGGVFGGLAVFTFTVRPAVVVTVALWLAVVLIVRLQPVLRLVGVLMNTSWVISRPCSAQVFIIIGVLLALLLGDVHVVLPACHSGISEISDW